MKRLTLKDENGWYLTGDGIYSDWGVPEKFRGEDIDRLAAIEDILGDEYDLDHLKELVQADREQMYMEPGFHINIQNGNDCFQSWWLRNRESTKEREQDG